MGASALSLPPLPEDTSSTNSSGMSGAGQMSPSGAPSAFGGGMPAMMQAMQQFEAGAQSLAQQLPSLAPMIAQVISQLRMAIPQAMSAGAAQQPGQGSGMSAPPPQQGQ